MLQNPNVPQSHPLKFRTIVHGQGGPKAAINDVIDDREELDEYAADCTGEKDREELKHSHPKFDKEKVIAVALGGRPTTLNSVEIVSVTQITGGFVGLMTQVSYVERGPVGPALPLDPPAFPHHVVRVKNAGGLIVFRRVTEHAPGPVMTTMMVGEEGPPMGVPGWGGGPGVPRFRDDDPSTMATGEEGGPPTTMATGEEMGSMLGAEDMGYPDPSWYYRTRGRGWGGGGWGGGWGGGPFGGF